MKEYNINITYHECMTVKANNKEEAIQNALNYLDKFDCYISYKNCEFDAEEL